MAARKLTAAQQHERRTRIAAIVLGAVFVLICAIQIPRVLHQLHPSTSAAPTTSTTPGDAASASLLSAIGPAAPTVDRLSRFAVKNPFPQVTTTSETATTPTPPPTTTAAAAPPSPPTKTAPPPPTPTKPVAAPAAPTLTVPFAPTPTRPGVLLAVAGNRRSFARGDEFPKAQPVFRVVGFTAKVARLRLLTGTLPGGGQVLTLELQHRVVLRNTTDGTSLSLEYVRPAKLPLRAVAPKPAR